MNQDTPAATAGGSAAADASRNAATTERNSNRLISGIDLIDFGVGGLFPERVYLVKGGIGMGKSVVGLQFLTRGLELHEPGILITDQKPAHVLDQAKSIGFGIEEAVNRQQLTILNPSKRYFELVESPADVMAIIDELADYVQKIGAKRLVIDPIYTLVNTSYSTHFALSVTQSLINALEELPVTTLLIAGDEDNAELTPIIHMIEQNSFGVMALSSDKTTGGRLMRLSKLRYASNDHLAAHYRILDGRGLINYRGEEERVTDVTKPWEDATVNRTVLVLGAAPETIKKVTEALGSDYTVTAESDMAKGVERVREEKPGLVLVTPARSIATVGALLELVRDSSSSIAFLSPATNRSSDKVLYLRAGADDFITEPFSPAELKARTEALIRRSGRRLNVRDSTLSRVTPEEISGLLKADDKQPQRAKEVLNVTDGNTPRFDPAFEERLRRNVETISKLDMNFTLYWMKSKDKAGNLNKSLAQLCRQEDILCRNTNGEFVAMLTGTDENGVKGFESRLREKLGADFENPSVKKGYAIYAPGQPVDQFNQQFFGSSAQA